MKVSTSWQTLFYFSLHLLNKRCLSMRIKGDFEELIKIREDDIEYFNNSISNGSVASDRIESVKNALISCHLQLINASYSNGADKGKIKKILLNAINAFEDGFVYNQGYGDYDQMLWLVSLGILCDVSSEEFSRITEILKRDNVHDVLLDTLIKFKQSNWLGSSNNYIQKHPYAHTQNISDLEGIQKYLNEDWYKGHSDAAWHNSHQSKQNKHFAGYWAWEAAAIVKIKRVNTESLEEQKYLPFDSLLW